MNQTPSDLFEVKKISMRESITNLKYNSGKSSHNENYYNNMQEMETKSPE
jgi:hypothetical protein